MNRLFLVRHGGSTANEDESFYQNADSAICLTTNGIRQALSTANTLAGLNKKKKWRWGDPGNIGLEAYVSEYTRAQQTARVCLDQMEFEALIPKSSALINERNYGTKYQAIMDSVPDYTGNDSESQVAARPRARTFIEMVSSLLSVNDIIAFSHKGAIRALIAELLDLTNDDMMKVDVANGEAFGFERTIRDNKSVWAKLEIDPDHVIEKTYLPIKNIQSL